MNKKVLVAYASKHGATGEIAEKIGEIIGKAGFAPEVVPVKSVGNMQAYEAIVLGSAAYVGQWRKEAVRLLKTQESILKQRPVWLFSSGPTGEGDPIELLSGWVMPSGLRAVVERIKPRDVAVFHGVLDTDRLTSIERFVIKKVNAAEGDFRDWKAISSWAAAIAETLKQSGN